MSSFKGVVRSTRRSASACSAAYMPASRKLPALAPFPDPFEDPFAVAGRMRATTAAAASLGEMLLATSRGVDPAGNSLMEPSGR